MSLLDDYEELCNAQDISIFKGVLDEVLRPIIIQLEEFKFSVWQGVDKLGQRIDELKGYTQGELIQMEERLKDDIGNINDMAIINKTYCQNMFKEIAKLQSEIESIKLNLKK